MPVRKIRGFANEELVQYQDSANLLGDLLTESEMPFEIRSFDDFVQTIFAESMPQYNFNTWHIRKICSEIDNVLMKPRNRYLLAVLPRYHLKSTIIGYGATIYRILTSYGDGMYISFKDELAQYHLGNIKSIVEENEELSKIMMDLNPRSDTAIHYKIGSRKMKMFGSGIFAVKRGIHCLVPDTKIYVGGNPNLRDGGGLRNISDIHIGTKVRTHNNRYMKVLKTFKRFIDEEIIFLDLDNGENVRITSNHLILTKNGWKKAGLLNVDDVLMKLKFYNHSTKNKTYEEIYGERKASQLRKTKFRNIDRSVGHLSEKKNRTFEQIYGIERANEIKNKRNNFIESKRVLWQCLECGVVGYLTIGQARKRKFCSKRCNSKYHAEGTGFNFRAKVGNFSLSNNPNWKDGKSFLPPESYGEEFTEELKTLIRKRDYFTCQVCGERGWVIHHIDYNKQNNDEHNLITLCKLCHVKTNINCRQLFTSLFQELMLVKYEKITNGTKILKIEKKHYVGFVHNLEVEEDNSYCGKGIVYHNCDSIVIADDVLGDLQNQLVLTELEKAKRIFNAEAMNIPNAECPLFVFGTVIDYTDLLFALKDNPNFNSSLWLPALYPDADHEVLWEDKFNREILEERKITTGWKAFSTEFLLTPLMATEAFVTRDELDTVIDRSLRNFQIPGY